MNSRSIIAIIVILVSPSFVQATLIIPEVWTGNGAVTGRIRRYSLDRDYLGDVPGSAGSTDAMVVVGDEVWTGSASRGTIQRYSLDGNFLPSFDSERIDAMAVVGDEVWTGSAGAGYIKRYSLDGNVLGSFSSGRIDAMVVIPEPATLLLLGLGVLVMRRRRLAS